MNANNTLFRCKLNRLFICILLVGCNLISIADDLDIPVMQGGYDSKVYELKEESARQLSFKIDLPHRSKSAHIYYVDFYRSKGWSLCGEVDDWSKHSYLDDNKKIIDAERMLTYFLNTNDDSLSLIHTQYELSELTDDGDSATQSISVIEYYDVSTYDLVSLLSLNCSNNGKDSGSGVPSI